MENSQQKHLLVGSEAGSTGSTYKDFSSDNVTSEAIPEIPVVAGVMQCSKRPFVGLLGRIMNGIPEGRII
jgi:hypothetical protein